MKQAEITVRVALNRGPGHHRLDLRPVARLRVDQRRLPFLSSPDVRPDLADPTRRVDARASRIPAARGGRPRLGQRRGLSLAPARDRLRHQACAAAGAQSVPISLDDLKNIDEQKKAIEQNTRQFVRGVPANNVLLTGSRGTGKSSLIKACLNAYSARGCA
jgi:hypothetical protein